jgi:hypothetical protein
MDLARSIQAVTEEIILNMARYARAVRPALEALAAWMTAAPLDDALVPLPQALRAGARSVPLEVLDAARLAGPPR